MLVPASGQAAVLSAEPGGQPEGGSNLGIGREHSLSWERPRQGSCPEPLMSWMISQAGSALTLLLPVAQLAMTGGSWEVTDLGSDLGSTTSSVAWGC